MTTILDYAKMSQAVYQDAPDVTGWTRGQFRSGLGAGLQAVVFSRGQTTVAAFKGTDPNASDVVADLKLGTGMNTSYFSDAEEFCNRFCSVDGLVVTGHSLGGAIAQIVGNRRRIPFVTFNAPGVALVASRNVLSSSITMGAVRTLGAAVSTVRHPMQALRDMRSAFHTSLGVNYRLSADIVSQIGLHYGDIVSISGEGNPLEQHKIATMIAALERHGYGNLEFPG